MWLKWDSCVSVCHQSRGPCGPRQRKQSLAIVGLQNDQAREGEWTTCQHWGHTRGMEFLRYSLRVCKSILPWRPSANSRNKYTYKSNIFIGMMFEALAKFTIDTFKQQAQGASTVPHTFSYASVPQTLGDSMRQRQYYSEQRLSNHPLICWMKCHDEPMYYLLFFPSQTKSSQDQYIRQFEKSTSLKQFHTSKFISLFPFCAFIK